MGKKTSLPKNAPIGTTATRTITVKGNKRKLTWERVRAQGKNKNISWKLVSNEDG